MWLSGQQKQPHQSGEGQTGIVTMSEGEMAVMLETERRGLEVYAPAGYHWTPQPGQRVLVIQGDGEIPCIAGVRQGGIQPDSVGISANSVSVSGKGVSIRASGSASVGGQSVNLQGRVLINGETLEAVVAKIVASLLGGM